MKNEINCNPGENVTVCQCYEEGAQAARNDVPETACPYPDKSLYQELWLAGYFDFAYRDIVDD
jgi:hypothetical protein